MAQAWAWAGGQALAEREGVQAGPREGARITRSVGFRGEGNGAQQGQAQGQLYTTQGYGQSQTCNQTPSFSGQNQAYGQGYNGQSNGQTQGYG